MSNEYLPKVLTNTDSWLDDVESFFSLFSRKKEARDPLAEKCNQKSVQVQKQITALSSLPKLKGYQQTCQERLQKAMRLSANDGLATLGELSVEISSQVVRHQEALAANEKLAAAEKEFTDASKIISRSLQDLQKTQGAVVDQAKKLFDQAVNETEPDTVEGYGKGVATLKLAEAEIRRQAAAATAIAEEAKKQLGKKPEYEKKLSEAQVVIGKIAALPSIGITPNFKKLQARVDAAKSEAAKGQYGPALAALGDFSTVKVEEFAKESAQMVKGLQEIPAAARSEAALKSLRALETPIAWKADREAVNVLLSAVLDAPDKQKVTLEKLDLRAATLEDKVIAREKLRLEVDALLQKLVPAMGAFRENAWADAAAPELAEYATLPRLRSGGELELALAIGQSLLDRVEKTTATLKAGAAEWEKNKAEAAELHVKLQAFNAGSKPAPPNFLIGQASPLAWLVEPKLVAELTKQKDWARLQANLVKVRDAFPALPVQLDAWTKFQRKRDDADIVILDKLQEAREALRVLTDRLDMEISEDLAADMQEVAPFGDEIKSIASGWQNTLDKAIDPATLKLADFESRVDNLLERLQAAGGEKGFRELVGQAETREKAEAFKKSYAAFQARIATLRNSGPGKALDLAARAEKIGPSAAGNWAEAESKLGDLDKEVASELDAIKQARTKLDQEVEKHLAVLNRDLKEVVERGNDTLNKAGVALNKEAKLLFAQVRSENLEAATFALAEIERFMGRVVELSKEFKGGAMAVAGTSVSEAVARSNSIEQRWQAIRKELQTYTDAREKELKKEWDKLKESVPTLNPNAAIGRLLDFDHALTLAADGAERVKELDAAVAANVKLATEKLETLTKRETGQEKYTASLKKRLEVAEKMAKDKTQLYGAQSRLEDLLAEIGADLESVTSVAQKAAEMQANEEAAAEADKAWGPAKERMKAKIAEVEALVKAQEGDPGMVSELKALFAQAEKTAGDDKILNKVGIKNDGDRATALRQLQVAGERARQIIADPVGPTIGSRNQLPKDVEGYKASLQGLLAVINGLPVKVQGVVSSMIPPVSKKLASLLEGATRSLSPHAFDALVARMTHPDITPPKQRECRELALAQVRQLRDTLNSHPQLKALREIPVETGAVTGAFQRLLQALTRMEANLSRSCR